MRWMLAILTATMFLPGALANDDAWTLHAQSDISACICPGKPPYAGAGLASCAVCAGHIIAARWRSGVTRKNVQRRSHSI